MIPTAYPTHQIPGRMRLRVPEKRGDPGYFESVSKVLSRHPDVQRLVVTPATASILIHHREAAETIIATAGERGLFAMAREPLPERSHSAVEVNTKRILPSALDAIANGLAGLAVLQAARGQPLGNAVENFWNGYGARRILDRPGLAAIFAALGVYQAFRGRYLGSAASLYFYSLMARQLAALEKAKAGARRDTAGKSMQRSDNQVAILPKRSSKA